MNNGCYCCSSTAVRMLLLLFLTCTSEFHRSPLPLPPYLLPPLPSPPIFPILPQPRPPAKEQQKQKRTNRIGLKNRTPYCCILDLSENFCNRRNINYAAPIQHKMMLSSLDKDFASTLFVLGFAIVILTMPTVV